MIGISLIQMILELEPLPRRLMILSLIEHLSDVSDQRHEPNEML